MMHFLKHKIFIPAFFYSAVLLVGWACLMVFAPKPITDYFTYIIAGWTVGGWSADVYNKIN